MSDPVRLLDGEASGFERELLDSVFQEPVPEAMSVRMAAGLGLGLGVPRPDSIVLPAAQGMSKAASPLLKFFAAAFGVVGVGAGVVGVLAALRSGTPTPAPNERAEAAALQSPREPAKAEPSAAEVAPAEAAIEPAVPAEGRDVLPVSVNGEQDPGNGTEPRRVLPPRAKRSSADGAFVERELAMLEPARVALKRGERDKALRLLAVYEQRFPQGTLRREASLLRARAQSR
jgi:hypothetical protein